MQHEEVPPPVRAVAVAADAPHPGRQRTAVVVAGIMPAMLPSSLDRTVVRTATPRMIAAPRPALPTGASV